MSSKPISVSQTLTRAKAFTKSGAFSAALDQYNLLLAKFPNNKQAAKAIVELSKPKQGSQPSPGELEQFRSLYATEQFDQAKQLGLALRKRYPNFAYIHYFLGAILVALKDLPQAILSFQDAIICDPDYGDALGSLGTTFIENQQPKLALEPLEYAHKLDPKNPAPLEFLGSAYLALGDGKTAANHLKDALELKPRSSELQNRLGRIYSALGNNEQALDHYDQAIALSSTQSITHYNRSGIHKYATGDAHIEVMEKLARRRDVPAVDFTELSFALGKAYDDIGEYDRAFKFFEQGCAQYRAAFPYNIEMEREAFERRSAKFTNATLATKTSNEPRPIFILGMPRSGTTLLERLLGNHPDIHPAGELGALEHAVKTDDVAKSYFENLPAPAQEAHYFTDKMPANFQLVGYILTKIPNATILHSKRDAMAVCWSNYRNYFNSMGMAYTYNLADLGHYYNLYEDQMAFWEKTFPNQITDINYQDLTKDTETQIRRALDACGLPFDPACVQTKSTGTILTASSGQANKPIYQGSSEAWKNYEPYLGDLIDALAQSS